FFFFFFFFQAEDGIRDLTVTGVQTCALPISIWWFYLFWLPKFLDARFGLKLSQLIAPLVVIYLIADVGSIFGGWLSGALIKRGRSEERRVGKECRSGWWG